MRDFWEVYDAHYEQVGEELKVWLDEDPEFGPMFGNMPPEQWAGQQRESRRLLRRAIVEGDWGPYLEDLRAQGRGYAAADLSFRAWFNLVGAFRPHVTPRLVAAYGDDMERLISAFSGMDAFIDTAMAVIGETYLVAKEDTIRDQQGALRELSTPVLKVRQGRLILPIVGLLDSERAQQLTDQLLEAIRVNRAKAVVVDITGVPAVDSEVANHLLQTVDACKLMGPKW
jgi:rsbT co-antagonist protein RsbR